MIKHCEIKLVDIFADNWSMKSNNQNKVNMKRRSQSNKQLNKAKKEKIRPTDDLTIHSNNEINLSKQSEAGDNCVNIILERTTRSSKRIQTNTPELKSCIIPVVKNKTQKRKSSLSESNTPLNKKPSIENVPCPSNSDGIRERDSTQKEVKRKKTRNKSKTFSESKLTGAKRVSRRLKNLQCKGHNVNSSINYSDSSITAFENKRRNHTKYSVEKNIKTSKITKRKYNKRDKQNSRKSDKDSSRSVLQSNYGKLNYTKKLYPRISAVKRVSRYRTKPKSNDTSLNDISQTNTPGNMFTIDCKSISDIKTITVVENEDTDTTDIIEVDSNVVSANKEESVTDGNSVGQNDDKSEHQSATTNSLVNVLQNESTEQGGVCGNIQEDCVSGSEIVVIDLKSDDKTLTDHSEECEIVIPIIKSSEKCDEKNKDETLITSEEIINLVNSIEEQSTDKETGDNSGEVLPKDNPKPDIAIIADVEKTST